ncbi:MAG: hypothetical protein H7330_02025 [Hymenobacteraceae bacterium]|nr:hypothetical protein [Hymenobacteraceae bacterium]
MTITDLIGSLGVGLLLLAFLLQLAGRLAAGSVAYALLNTVGAGLACLASALLPYWPFVVLEGSWTLVSLGALVKALRAARPGPTEP